MRSEIEKKLEGIKSGQAVCVEGGISMEEAEEFAKYFTKKGHAARMCEVCDGCSIYVPIKHYSLHILK